MNVEQLASICHDANASYCRTHGDFSQLPWDSAQLWQRTSVINGVAAHIANPDMTPEMSHASWLKEKHEDGWVYGETKDADTKQHPCMLPYSDLPEDQRIKDELFTSIINVFRDYVVLDMEDANDVLDKAETGS